MHKRTRLLTIILTTVTLLVAACSPNPGISIPAAPTGLTLAPGEGKIILSWQDNSSNEIGFAIFRKEIALGSQQNQAGEFEQIDTVPADTTTYEDTTVEVAGLYQYGVSAVGEGGTSEVSGPQDDTPVQPVNLAPEADAQTVTASEDSLAAFTLTGSDPEEMPLEFTVASQPEHGTLSGTAPNLTYTPDPNFNGSDSFEFTVSDGGADSAAATVTLTVDPVNDAPVVEDSILTTSEDTPVDVLMSASDVDGDALSYEIVSAPSHGTLSGTGSTQTYTPDADFTGSDSFRFRVNDGTVNSGVATVILDVKAAGDPPLADPQSVTTDEDTPVSIVLGGSDPDGDPLTFTLVGSPDHGSLSGTAPNLLYLPDPDYNGSDSFSFTVSDGGADSTPAAVSITVNPVADAPEFTSTPVTGAVQDTPYSYDVAAGDDDAGDTLAITASTKPAWLTLTDNGGGSATLSGTPTNAEVGDHDVELLVTDDAGATDTQSFTVTVSNDNDAPAFDSTPVTDATEDSPYSYDVETSDIDVGDTHRITPAAALPGWLNLTDLGDGTATLSGTPSNDEVGDHDVELRVTDAAGAAATQSFTITVGNGNDAPEFTSTPIVGAAQDTPYSYDVAAGDDDVGDTLAITAVTKPAWLTLTDNGGGSATLSGTPTNAEVGDHDVELLVTDLAGETDTQSFTITVSNDNDAPAFTSTPVIEATEDSAYSYAVETSDIDAGDTHRITPAAALPGWLNLTDLGDGTASLSGTPTNAEVGDHDVSLRVTDALGAAATQSYTVTVSNTNDAPTLDAAIDDQNTDEDAPFSLDVSSNFSDIDAGDTLTFSATGQPASLTMSEAGVLSGTPTNDDVGSYTVTVTADDGNGGTVSGEFGLTVDNTNDAPTLDAAIKDQNTDEDAPFSLDVSGNFSDIDTGDTLTFTATGQPASLTMSPAGVLSGTPTNDDVGTYTVTVTADDSNGGTATDEFELVISNTNDAPAFTSTPVTGAVQDTLYNYDVAAGDDDAGDTLAITAVTKPAWLTLTDNGGGSATLGGTPTNAAVGDHDVELLVTDLAGETDTQSFTVTVSNTNDAPSFTSTPVTSATEDSAYSYDVETSDADVGDTLRITPAAALPGWLSLTDFGDGTASLSGTPTNAQVGDHTVELRVTDALGAAATQSYTVTVSNTNDAPTLDAAIDDQNTDEDAPFSLDVSGNFSDIDTGDTLTFSATGQPASLTMSEAGVLSGTPTNDDVGTYTVTVTADDSNGGTATDEFELEIVNTNDAPTLDAAIADQSGDEDSAFSLDVSGNFSDIDTGDTLTFTATGQPASLTMSPAGVLSGTPTNDDVGTYTVTVTADDSNGGTATDEFELVISNTNDAPAFTSTPVTGAVQDTLYNYDVAAGDDDAGDTLAITAVTKPAWLTLTDNGGGSATLGGTPTNAAVGDHDVELLVTDLAGETDTQSFTVTVSNTNDAPSFTSTPVTSATEDSAYSYDVETSDADVGDTLRITPAAALPGWLSLTDFGDGTASLSGTPTNAQVGDHTVELRVTDALGAAATQSYTVTVSNTNDAPTLDAAIDDQNTDEDAPFSLDVSGNFSDIDTGDTLTFSATGQPASLTMSEAGVLSGTPTNDDVGTYTVTVTADDSNGGTATDEFELEIVNTNDAPTLDAAIADQSGDEDSAFSLDVSGNFSDIDTGDTLTFTATGQPASLTMSPAGVLSGTPTNDDVGTYTVTVTADDSNGGTATDEFELVISNTNDAPAFTSTPVTGAVQDTLYNYDVAAGDDDAGDTLAITAVTKPAWLTLTDNGGGSATLGGTPTNAAVGDHDVELLVTDLAGETDTQSFTVTVSNTNDAPSFTSTPVTSATEDSAYSYDVETSDPDVGDTVTITGETLPSWLALTDLGDGTATLSGTPSNDDVGDHDVELRVTDAGGAAATQSYTVTVDNTNDAPVADDVSASAAEDGPAVTSDFAGSDVDDGDSLTYAITSTPAEGSAGNNNDGTFSFDPDSDFQDLAQGETRDVSFDYTASDALAAPSNTATVTVTVTGVNDAPVITEGDTISPGIGEDQVLNIVLNATDVDGDILSWSISSPATNGTALASGSGNSQTVVYTPDPSYSGTDSFDVQVSDGNGGSDTITVDVSISDANDAPFFVSDPVTGVDEDTLYSYDIVTDDSDAGDTLEINEIVLPAWLTLTDIGDGTGTLTGTPTNDEVGNHPVSLVVSDAAGTAALQTFTITVANTNDSPVISEGDGPIAVTMDEDGSPTAFSLSLNATDVDVGDTLEWSISSAATNGTASIDQDGVVSYTPKADYNGGDSFEVQVSDGYAGPVEGPNQAPTDTVTVNVTINPIEDSPVAIDDAFEVDEDGTLNGNVITKENLDGDSDSDPDGDTVTVVDVDLVTPGVIDPVLGPNNGTLTISSTDGSFTYTPGLDFNGTDSFTYRITDDPFDTRTDDATVTITVNAINDEPSFSLIVTPNQAVDEDAGAQTVNTLATDFNPGGGTDESGQSISDYIVTNDNNDLFSTQPDIDNDGNLTYTPADNANGSATVSVQVKDDGGTVNLGDVDTSDPALTFTITVNPINDEPAFSLPETPDQTVDEDAGAQTVNTFATTFKPGGGTDESGQSVSDYIVTNDNASLFSVEPDIDNDGNLTYTPADNANGSATVSVKVKDDGGTVNLGDVDTSDPALTFTITVNAINDEPSFSLIVTPNQAVAEDAGAQTVNTLATDFNPGGGTDESGQSISDYIVTNDNNDLFSTQPDIDNDGNLTYTPADNANGSATVSVQVKDDGGTVNLGDVDTSDPALTFTITVNPINDEPAFSLPETPDQTVDEDAGAQTVNTFATTFKPGGGTDESGQSVSDYIVTNDNASLFSVEPDIDNDGNLTYTPADNANGSATVSVKVKDDGGTVNLGDVDTSDPALTFTITVNAINDEPSFSLIVTPNQAVAEDAGAQTVNTLATDFNPGGGTDESGQSISDYIVTNDNNDLFSTQPDIDNDGNLTYTPADNANGSATVSVQVKDDGGTVNLGDVDTSDPALTFTITVNPINDPPTANDDTGTTDKSALLVLVDPDGAEQSLFANDSDTEDDPLSLVSFDATSTMGASINVLPDGRFSYDPRFAPALQALQPCETAEDTFTYTIQDPSTAQDTATVTITVTSAGNCLPSFTSTPVTEATEGESYTYNVTADDEDGTATLSITATTKPAWLTLTDLGNGAATLSGTPGAGDVGGNAVTLEVDDGAGGSDTQSFTITVAAASSAPTPDFVAVFSGGSSFNSGDTTGAADDLGNPSGDHVYQITIPAGATSLDAFTCLPFAPDFDTVLRLLDATGTEVAFNDNDDLFVWCGSPYSYITYPVTAGQVYYVVVEGVGLEEGLYDLFLEAR